MYVCISQKLNMFLMLDVMLSSYFCVARCSYIFGRLSQWVLVPMGPKGTVR